MSEGQKYRNPPIIEALCELSFQGSQWDETIPGQFHALIKTQFPTLRRQAVQQAELAVLRTGEATASVRPLEPRTQFVSESGNRLVQLAPGLLVVNQLVPYPHFAAWEPTIYEMARTYRDLARPSGLSGISMRYINRIVIPLNRVKMETYFTVYPQLPVNMGDEHGPFVIRLEIPSSDAGHEDHKVLVTFGSAPPEPGKGLAYSLDLYDIVRSEIGIPFDRIESEVKVAQSNVEKAFEGSITDALRALFEPEKPS